MKPLEALRALGTGGEAPVESKQRVRAGLIASLGAAAVTMTAASVAAPRLAASSSAPGSLIGGLTNAKALVIAGGIWLVGGATGAALYGALHAPEVRVVYVDRPVLSHVAAASAPTPIAMGSASPPNTTTPSPALGSATALGSKRAAHALPISSSDLARERALLDLARESAAHGEPARVLRQTELHRAQFPQGKLSEEREALAIRALLSLGRADEARDRARAFQLTHPNSMLLPVIDSALSAP